MNSARKRYTFSGTGLEIERQLAELQESDKESEELAQSGSAAGTKGILKALGAGAAGFVLGLLSEQVLPRSGSLAVFAIFGCWGVGLAGFLFFAWRASKAFSMASKARMGDIDDIRYLGLGRLHQFLKLDTTEAAQFQYELDFRGRSDSNFKIKSEPYRGGKEKHYVMPVLKARVKLKDGTTLQLAIEQRTRLRVYSKVNPRGKVKTKRKHKWVDIYRLQLKTPSNLGEHQSALVPAGKALLGPRSQPQFQVSGQKVSALCKRQVDQDRFAIQPALMLATWAYLNLNLLRSRASS